MLFDPNGTEPLVNGHADFPFQVIGAAPEPGTLGLLGGGLLLVVGGVRWKKPEIF